MNEVKILADELPYKVVTELETNLSPEVIEIIRTVYQDAITGKNGIIQKLKKLTGKYPDVKELRNYLVQAYFKTGNVEQAIRVNDQLLKDFPDYLFARLFKAGILLHDGKPELCREMLGTNVELNDLYPERTEFHVSEFMTYQKTAINYFVSTGNIEEAERRLSLMKKQDINDPEVKTASLMVMQYNLEKAAKSLEEGEKYRRQPFVKQYNKEMQTTEPPVFNHPEIEVLYHNTLRIDPALISNILQLPRQSLLEDLHSILDDAIRRFEYFRDKPDLKVSEDHFVMHALFLLAELGSEQSLPHLLNFLRQGEELLEFWVGDFLTEDMWEILYHCGQNQLSILKDFIKEPNNYMYARSAVATAVQQIALHQPERKAEVLEWYRDLLQFLLENGEDENITDTSLNAFLITDIIPLGAEDFTELITGFFKADLADPDITGELEEVLSEIQMRTGVEHEKRDVLTDAFSRYENVLNSWPFYTSKKDLKPVQPAIETSSPPQLFNPINSGPNIKDKKTGRNDPCPCGSGKKYKKCCM
jgi:tetratricopeptide (TPR) repeat protein